MKKTFYLLALITASRSMLLAQPTLEMNIVPETGDFIYWAQADSSTAQVGSPGANQIWDFSDLSSSTPPTRYEYVTPANTPYANEFPTATLATKHDYNSGNISYTIYSYFQKGANQLLLLGAKNLNYKEAYTDPDVQRQYPFHFNDTYQDDYTRTWIGSGAPDYPGLLVGTRTVEYDAYGTLITPLDTFQNAMRIRTTMVLFDSITFYYGHQRISYETRTTYDWVVAHQPGPLVSISYSNITTIWYTPYPVEYTTTQVSPKIKTVNYISAGTVSTLSETKAFKGLRALSVSPNPTIDQLTLFFTAEQPMALQICLTDAGGRMLRIQKLEAGVGENRETFFVGDLPAGAYFLSLTDGRRIWTTKWQKK